MVECSFCGESFDSERELHIHWGESHEDELNSHQEEEVKKAEREVEAEKESRRSRRRKMLLKAGTGLAGLIVVALVLPQILTFFQGNSFKLDQQPTMGSENASVQVVMFGDYRCPACKSFDENVLPRLKNNYIGENISFHFINYVILGEGSKQAAKASECVYRKDPENFWSFHDTVYKNQGPESTRWVSEDLLTRIATQETDIKPETLQQCIAENSSIQEAVEMDKKIGRKAGVAGTPTIFVNGERVGSSYNAIKQAIESHLN